MLSNNDYHINYWHLMINSVSNKKKPDRHVFVCSYWGVVLLNW